MQNQINLVGEAPDSVKYAHSTFEAFKFWAENQQELQLDIETNVTPYWCDKKLITIQFGQVGVKDGFKHQWVFQWSKLSEDQKQFIKELCEDPTKTKLIHNAAFECIVLHFHDIVVDNVFDTMLCEKITTGGIENDDYALTDLTYKYIGVTLDKSEQTTFGNDILTENKVVYAATDTMHLDVIRDFQMIEINKWKLNKVLDLENEAVLSFSDITYNGMELNQVKWQENADFATPVVEDSLRRMNAWLTQEPFKSKAIELGYLSETDKVLINYNSHQQKLELLQMIFPDIIGGTQVIIKKYIRDNGPTLPADDLNILVSIQEKNYQPLTNRLIRDYTPTLINLGYLLPANTPTVNWNSVDQTLPFLQLLYPKLKNLSEESLSKYTHTMIDDLGDYKDSLKLLSTYGAAFVEKHVEPDGKVRTEFNQIVSTGRVSSKRPNMQNIPAKESPIEVVQPWLDAHPDKKYDDFTTRYRNAFVCDEDEEFVDSDFTGQELAIIAHISKDPVWVSAITKGEDLHSVCAELVFGPKWLAGKEENCAFYERVVNTDGVSQPAHLKCKCPKHKTHRGAVKSINFGLAYGMSEMKLSGELKITVPEAKALITQYFKQFPKIGSTLEFLGRFGVERGWTQTIAPFFRKRWFPFWRFAKVRIQYHLSGQYDATLGAIERQSKNTPIQGTGADMMKYAMVLVRRYIYKNNLQDVVKLRAQVHDQLTTTAKKHFSNEWKVIFDGLMQEAARLFIPSGILKADTQISPTWTK